MIYMLALVAVLSGFIYTAGARARSYRRELENTWQRAFIQLASEMDDIDSTLLKCTYATTPAMLSSACAQVFGKAMSAQTALSELPIGSNELEETAGFISRVQDYAYFLSRTAAAGTVPDQEQRENLASLSRTASVLAGNLTRLAARLRSEDSFLLTDQMRQASGESDGAAEGSDGFKQIESEFPEVPSLIYDGPFSAHISRMEPLLLKGMKEVSAGTAIHVASDFTGLDSSVFAVVGERSGSLPVYLVTALVDGGELSIEVTKVGGVVLSLLNSRTVQTASLSSREAADRAADFLAEQGYEDMRESYWITEENRVTVNFAFCQDGVVCYSDLVKVTVAMDTGSVVGFESEGYVMSHIPRALPDPRIGEEEARRWVSPELTVLAHQMAVIPTSGKNEVFCHEFKCEAADGRHYIVYVNAETGAEEKLLILLESENGTLTV